MKAEVKFDVFQKIVDTGCDILFVCFMYLCSMYHHCSEPDHLIANLLLQLFSYNAKDVLYCVFPAAEMRQMAACTGDLTTDQIIRLVAAYVDAMLLQQEQRFGNRSV